ncbi:DUF5985 family protein [Rhizobium sp. LjRoot98]|uniref:DUF5985 family protein n=1 Tax=Rhizobium sp. LjRoot98 TaxID=3342345 RepID=UPI000B10A491
MFFIRFWRRTRDALFAAFAAAFWLLALNQALLASPICRLKKEAGFICCVLVLPFLSFLRSD